MIAVSVDIQVDGLGRCWSRYVDHNNIYLFCPTTKTEHVYRLRSGLLSMIHGASSQLDSPVAKKDDATGKILMSTQNVELGSSRWFMFWREWSYELALKTTPVVCSKVVQMILERKDKDDIYKLLADTNIGHKLKFMYRKSTNSYSITYNEEEVDLEQALIFLFKEDYERRIKKELTIFDRHKSVLEDSDYSEVE